MRRITNGRRHRVVGSYYSLKNGRGVSWESRVELHAFYQAEVDTAVKTYRAQPHTLEMICEGRKYFYTPDREDTLADGRIEIIEIKDLHDPSEDIAYSAKLELAQGIYQNLGWSFRIMERAEIEAEPRYRAVETVQSYRRTALTTLDIMAVQKIAGGRPITLGDLCEALGPPELGLRKSCAMAVRRIIAIELDRGLISQAVVQLLEEEARDHG
jgi:hypothetical protein